MTTLIASRVKHVSFDVWNTLIQPNPDFAAARNEFLADTIGVPQFEVASIYKFVKGELDALAETRGVGYRPEAVYRRFLDELGRDFSDWATLQRGVQRLFLEYPPLVRPDVVRTVKALDRHGVSISIASNTNFVTGETLGQAALDQWGVDWLYKVFSDEIAVSKPHNAFWNTVLTHAARRGVLPGEILHVGDNRICDGGCQLFGTRFQLIDGPHELANALENYF